DHAGAAAEGTIVGGAVLVGAPLAQIMHLDADQPRGDALAQDALGQKPVEHAREKRQDVDVQRHGKRDNGGRPADKSGAKKIARATRPGRLENESVADRRDQAAGAAAAVLAFLMSDLAVSVGFAPLEIQ